MRDHIAPGRYRVQVIKVEDGTSKSGKRMWSSSYKVSAGEWAGSNLGDNFVLVDNSGGASKMGLGRLHHFLLCLALPVKEAAFQLDLDNLSGRECEVEVADETFTDNSGSQRVSSAIKGYFAIKESNGNGSSSNGVTAAATVAEAAVEEEVAAAPDIMAQVEEQVDDLFK